MNVKVDFQFELQIGVSFQKENETFLTELISFNHYTMCFSI
jgi:hypothetical protein